jgi:trk system potassium uptake protein
MKKTRHSALIIGLGRFGTAVARRLMSLGWDVVGVDNNPAVVEDLQDELEHIMLLDARDEEALASVGISDFEVCIVARGGSIEGSVLFVLNLQHLEAQRIVAKAVSEYHARILRRLGVEHIVFPELDAGTNLAESLQAPHLEHWMPISESSELAVVRVPKGRAGCPLDLWREAQDSSLQILARISPTGKLLKVDRFALLEAGEILVVLGKPEAVMALGR